DTIGNPGVEGQAPVSKPAGARRQSAFSLYCLAPISIWSRKRCNRSTTRSARGCHPCLRYVPLPMSPGWTSLSLAEGEELESNILHLEDRRYIYRPSPSLGEG